jgi:hypothetical protein
VEFTYDPDKSLANLLKHSIDFEQAQELWNNRTVIIPSKHVDEPRSLVIGRIEGLHWTAITAEREGTTRIISVRRSRKDERQLYEEKCKDHDEGT